MENGQFHVRANVPYADDDSTKLPAILLIDDNAIQAATRQVILRRSGFYAIAVLNPRRALEQFQADEFPARIQAVITDHIMPELTGADFVTELRKTHPTLPVMVISGLEEAKPLYDDLDVIFLLKPLAPELLLSNLRSIIGDHTASLGPSTTAMLPDTANI